MLIHFGDAQEGSFRWGIFFLGKLQWGRSGEIRESLDDIKNDGFFWFHEPAIHAGDSGFYVIVLAIDCDSGHAWQIDDSQVILIMFKDGEFNRSILDIIGPSSQIVLGFSNKLINSV